MRLLCPSSKGSTIFTPADPTAGRPRALAVRGSVQRHGQGHGRYGDDVGREAGPAQQGQVLRLGPKEPGPGCQPWDPLKG